MVPAYGPATITQAQRVPAGAGIARHALGPVGEEVPDGRAGQPHAGGDLGGNERDRPRLDESGPLAEIPPPARCRPARRSRVGVVRLDRGLPARAVPDMDADPRVEEPPAPLHRVAEPHRVLVERHHALRETGVPQHGHPPVRADESSRPAGLPVLDLRILPLASPDLLDEPGVPDAVEDVPEARPAQGIEESALLVIDDGDRHPVTVLRPEALDQKAAGVLPGELLPVLRAPAPQAVRLVHLLRFAVVVELAPRTECTGDGLLEGQDEPGLPLPDLARPFLGDALLLSLVVRIALRRLAETRFAPNAIIRAPEVQLPLPVIPEPEADVSGPGPLAVHERVSPPGPGPEWEGTPAEPEVFFHALLKPLRRTSGSLVDGVGIDSAHDLREEAAIAPVVGDRVGDHFPDPCGRPARSRGALADLCLDLGIHLPDVHAVDEPLDLALRNASSSVQTYAWHRADRPSHDASAPARVRRDDHLLERIPRPRDGRIRNEDAPRALAGCDAHAVHDLPQPLGEPAGCGFVRDTDCDGVPHLQTLSLNGAPVRLDVRLIGGGQARIGHRDGDRRVQLGDVLGRGSRICHPSCLEPVHRGDVAPVDGPTGARCYGGRSRSLRLRDEV